MHAPESDLDSSPQLYLRQLLAGRDFAVKNPLATDMANYVYLIGDRDRGEAVVIDAAYAPGEIVDIADDDGMELVGAVVTHYHADHAGGMLGGVANIAGVTELLAKRDLPVHIQREERSWLIERTGIGEDSIVEHVSGETIMVGDLPLVVIHTPGHTEGSQCIMFERHLFTGDTLFLDGCGRTDLPGGDPGALYESLTYRLSAIADDIPIFPGHAYSPLPFASMGEVRRSNPVLVPLDREHWLARFAG
jgi:glyoxylase-like metal-dependent hydrolase (beta-lactamase superfamily II)